MSILKKSVPYSSVDNDIAKQAMPYSLRMMMMMMMIRMTIITATVRTGN